MVYGYFDDPFASAPAYDPGLAVDCPVCDRRLTRPLKTISLLAEGDTRSYFYRVHAPCYDALSSAQRVELDSVIIDFVALRGPVPQ
ncbi:MAG: hypothetical protein WCF84_02190 [Anaerolineae bacterium]